jgi:hypothetical protein
MVEIDHSLEINQTGHHFLVGHLLLFWRFLLVKWWWLNWIGARRDAIRRVVRWHVRVLVIRWVLVRWVHAWRVRCLSILWTRRVNELLRVAMVMLCFAFLCLPLHFSLFLFM